MSKAARPESVWRAVLMLGALAAVMLGGGCARQPIKMKLPERTPAPARVESPRPATLLATARILMHQGRAAESERLLRRLIDEEPRCAAAYSELAGQQIAQNRPAEALETLRQGLKEIPKDPVLLNNAGLCCLQADNYAGAAAYFERARLANPGEARYTANLAMTLALAGNVQEARRLYEQILPPEAAQRNLEILRRTRAEASVKVALPPGLAGK